MLVLYLFGSCPRIHGTPTLVQNEGVLCISYTVTGSHAIKWVALSIILTWPKVYCISTFGKCIWHQAILLAVVSYWASCCP